jgi:hypothetical protein
MLCVPGPWSDRTQFIKRVVVETKGEFMFAGMIIAEPAKKRHVILEFSGPDERLRRAFEIAGQGKVLPTIVEEVGRHRAVAYLKFPLHVIEQRDMLVDFTTVLRQCGGIAVKIESSGVAHSWDAWFEQMKSNNPFDWYRTFVCLIGDTEYYYSCGMHHFGLPEVEAPRSIETREAADLMNRFNYYQISEEPKLAEGHTFSLTPEAPRYRLQRRDDVRHDAEDDLFHNPHGIWRLNPVGNPQ